MAPLSKSTVDRLGERRSRVLIGYWQVSIDFKGEIPHKKFAQEFVERMARRDWRLEGELQIRKEPGISFDEHKDAFFTWTCWGLFSHPVELHTIEVPDELIPGLLADPRLGPLIVDVR